MPRRPVTIIIAVIAILVVVVVGGYGLYLANMAGRLPWQEEPTRIPVTPFANLPSSNTTTNDDEADDPAGTPVSDAGSWLISDLAYLPAADAA